MKGNRFRDESAKIAGEKKVLPYEKVDARAVRGVGPRVVGRPRRIVRAIAVVDGKNATPTTNDDGYDDGYDENADVAEPLAPDHRHVVDDNLDHRLRHREHPR